MKNRVTRSSEHGFRKKPQALIRPSHSGKTQPDTRAIFVAKEATEGKGISLESIGASGSHEAAPFNATFWKTSLAFWPKVVIAAMQTTMIRASITAYSTAVGPSSRRTKLTTQRQH
jgi:hypothetical protein